MASISSGITGTNAQIEISLGNSCIKVDINSSPGSQRTCTSCHGEHGSSNLSSAREKGRIRTRNSYLINRIDSQQNTAHQKFYDSSSYVNGIKENTHGRKRNSISNSHRDSFSHANHNMYDDHFRNRRSSSIGNCFMASAVNETQSVCTDADYEELSAEKNGSLTTDSRIFDLLEIDESHKIVTGRSVLIAKSSSLANPFQVSSSRSSSSSLSAENLFATAAMSTEQLASPAKITVIDSVNKAFVSSDSLFETSIPIIKKQAADTEVITEKKEIDTHGGSNGNYSAFLKLQESPSDKVNVKEKKDDEVIVKPESTESEQKYSLDVIKDTGTAVFYSKDPSLMMYLEESCLDQPQQAEKSQENNDEGTGNQHKELRLVKYIPQLPTSNMSYSNKIQDIKSSLELDDQSMGYQQPMRKKTSFKSIKCNRKDTLSSLLSSQLDLLKTHSAPETPHLEKNSSESDNFDLAMEASILDPDRIPFVDEYRVLSCDSAAETTGNKHLVKQESNSKSQFFNKISAPNTSLSAKSVEGFNSWVGFLNRHLKLDDNLEKSFILNTPGFEMSATEIKQMNTIASEQKPKSSPINELFGQKRARLSSRYRKSKNNESKESRSSDAENTNIDISKCSLCGKAKAYYYCDTCNKKHYYHHHRYHKKGSINWSTENDHTHKHKEEPEHSYCKSCRQKKTSQFEKVKQAKISARKRARKERRSKVLPKNVQNDKSVSPLRSEFLEFKTALESHVPTLSSAKSMKNAELKNVTDKKKVEVVISDSKIIDAAAHEESVEVKDSEKTDTSIKENTSSLEVSPKMPHNKAAKKATKKSSKVANKNHKKTKTKKAPTPESSIKNYTLESSKSGLVPRWQNRLAHPPLKKLYSRSPKFSKHSESAAQKGAATADFFENGVNAGSLSNTLISEPCPFRNQTVDQKETYKGAEGNLHNTLKDNQDQNNNFSLSRRAKLFFKGKNKFQKHSRNSKTEETKANPLGEILIN